MDKNTPTLHPLARLRTWGHPFHGTVQGGVLTLPGGLTKAYSQPGWTYTWEATAAHRFFVPGTPAVVRTVEQQADDAASGFSWLNYAVLSGGNSQLYSKPLGSGRFLWVDSAGDRWLVDASALHSQTWTAATVPVSVNITISKFGVFGAAADSHVVTVAVPNLGQSSPAVYSGGSVVTGFASSLYSIRHDGAAAVFMLHYAVASAWPCGRAACGWVELQLSGVGASAELELVVLHSREETLGSDINYAAGSSEFWGPEADSDGSYKLYLRGSYVEDYTLPDCTGYVDRVDTVLVSRTQPLGYTERWPDPEGSPEYYPYHVQPRSGHEAFSGVVLAIWYRADGSKATLTLDAQASAVVEDVYHDAGSAVEIRRRRQTQYPTVFGGCSLNTEVVVSVDVAEYTFGYTTTEAFDWVLKVDGVDVDRVVERYQSETSATVSIDGATYFTPAGAVSWAAPGASAATSPHRVAEIGAGVVHAGAASSDDRLQALNGPVSILRRNMTKGRRLDAISKVYRATGGTEFSSHVARVGHSAFAWLFCERAPLSSVASWAMPGVAVTPSGLQTFVALGVWSETYADSTTAFGRMTSGPFKAVFISRQPSSGDLAVGDGVVVCWV